MIYYYYIKQLKPDFLQYSNFVLYKKKEILHNHSESEMKSTQGSCSVVYIVIILSCLVKQCYVQVTTNDFYKHDKASTLKGNTYVRESNGIKYPHWSDPENDIISVCVIFLYYMFVFNNF